MKICNRTCSQSDFYKGGYCDKMGCYESNDKEMIERKMLFQQDPGKIFPWLEFNLKGSYENLIKKDALRLQKIISDNGYEVEYYEAVSVWEEYSEGLAANWITMPNDDAVVWRAVQGIVKSTIANR